MGRGCGTRYKKKDKKETEAFLEETKEDLGTSNTELSAVLESAGWNVDGSSRRC